jgi:TonB family protein
MRRQDNSCAPLSARPPAGAVSGLEAFTCWLIRRGARSAPPSLSERLEEEWRADLAAHRGRFSRLRFALGCCRASRVIAHELAAATRTAAAAAGPRSVTLYAQPDLSRLSPRTAVLLLILCLHALVIYALGAGLAGRVLEDIAPAIHVSFTESLARIAPPPPLPRRPEFTQPTVEIIESLIPLDTPPAANVIEELSPSIPEHPLPPPPTGVATRMGGGPGAGFPNTEDYYPAASRRIGEKGVATVAVCVDAAGRLTGEPLIAQSSGSARLDEGALRLARAGSGHYRPTTQDGRAVSACYPYRIRFELRD